MEGEAAREEASAGAGAQEVHRKLERRQSQLHVFEKLVASPTNMFINKTWKLTRLQKLSMVIAAVTFFPVRVVLTILNLLLIIIISWIGTIGITKKQRFEEPFPKWRRIMLSPVRLLIRLQLALFGMHWIKIKGKVAPRSEAPFLLPNHITFVEPIALVAVAGGTPLCAQEYAELPIIGRAFMALRTIPVARKAKGEAPAPGTGDAAPNTAAAGAAVGAATSSSALPPSPTTANSSTGTSGAAASPTEQKKPAPAPLDARRLAEARARDNRWPHVLLFPEGTTTNGTAVISFKTGAFTPGLPVQPVTIRYPWADSVFDPSWVNGGPGIKDLLIRLLLQWHTPLEIEFLPVYHPSPAEIADPRLFATNVQRRIARALGVRTTQHSLEDIKLMSAAQKVRYPIDKAAVEFEALRDVLDIDINTAQFYLRRFIDADKGKTGRLTYPQFRDLLLTQPKPDAAAAAAANAAVKSPSAALSPSPTSSASASAVSTSPLSGTSAKTPSPVSNVVASSATGAPSGAAALPETAPASRSEPSSSAEGPVHVSYALLRTFTGSQEEVEAAEAPVMTSSGQVVGSEEEVQRLFNLLDVDDNGSLDFRELLVGLAIVNDHGVHRMEDTFRLAFRLLDTTGRGKITKLQLEHALRRVWPDLAPETMDAIFAAADIDRDGLISSHEFVTWACKPENAIHLPLFKERLLGFADESALLAPAVQQQQAEEAQRLARAQNGARRRNRDE